VTTIKNRQTNEQTNAALKIAVHGVNKYNKYVVGILVTLLCYVSSHFLVLTYIIYFNLEPTKLSFRYTLNMDHEQKRYGVNSVTSTLALQLTNNGPTANTCYEIAITSPWIIQISVYTLPYTGEQ
jgi:hypothetical protein